MKLIITIPLVLIFLIGLNSCGSSPSEESMETRPVLNPPLITTQESVNIDQTAIPINPGLPVANWVAGRPGYVFNPYNQNMVEVNGLVSGTKVRDPLDPDPSHIFLVP